MPPTIPVTAAIVGHHVDQDLAEPDALTVPQRIRKREGPVPEGRPGVGEQLPP